MLPSKADRILSRYRPIAPKPLPIPPSGSLATDLSSTCASLDSFASSGKVRRARKRRIAPASSGKFAKTPKSDNHQVVSAISFSNAGVSTSSLTQGNSDATVPLADLSHVSHSFGMRSHVSTSQHMVMDVMERPCMPSGDPAVLATPFNHHLAGSLVEQARMFMVADAHKARQQPSLPLLAHARSSPGYGGGGIIEKDLEFMERAAASTVLPHRGASAGLSCSAVCMKGVSYGGGGFTEMIRGITRLPTVADVQSLMQARPVTQAMEPGMMPSSVENISCGQTSVCSEAHPQKLELQSPMPAAVPCWASDLPLRLPQADDCTLPLLPNVPSKPSISTTSLQAASLMHGSSYRVEHPLDHTTADLAIESSSENIPALSAGGSRGTRLQLGTLMQANNEADAADAPHIRRVFGGFSTSCEPSALSRDGTTVDQVYLQQVYGGSTDPVLLVDDKHEVLWFNKAYERALKSVSERLSSQPASTGPYIDPLGHPTPLASLVLNQASGSSKLVNSTLWGFLRKLVMPEVVASSSMMRDMKVNFSRNEQQYEEQGLSKLCLSVGERVPQSMLHMCSSSSAPARRIDDASEVQRCRNVGKLTTVTLESITEVYIGEEPVSVECVETVEARLGAAGSVPAFITDCSSRVRWMNTAFKQMLLGHSEQGGNNSGSNNGGLVKHEPPELTFVCSAEKIPQSAQAFSGLVNLEWMKSGKRRSMTVPCDVSRLVPTATWVWKFDLALSLSLKPCV